MAWCYSITGVVDVSLEMKKAVDLYQRRFGKLPRRIFVHPVLYSRFGDSLHGAVPHPRAKPVDMIWFIASPREEQRWMELMNMKKE